MRKFAWAAVFTLAATGFAVAEDFQALITKVDPDKGLIEYKKYSGKDKKFEDTIYKVQLASDAKILKNAYKLENDKLLTTDEEVKDGLKNAVFSREKGVNVTLSTADADDKDKNVKKGDVTKIHLGGPKAIEFKAD